MQSENRIILDLRGLVIQAFYEKNPQATVLNKNGKPVPSAAHGVRAFIDRYLHNILLEHPPISIIGVLEGGNQRRRAYLPSYKDKPAQDADDAVLQAEQLKAYTAVQNLIVGLGGMLTACPTVEADDMIAYLCERLPGHKHVYTVDADLLQLLKPGKSDSTLVHLRGEPCTQYKGIDLMVQPTSMVTLYKSIVGDSTDGYPGVTGIGPAGWEHLIKSFGWETMDGLNTAVSTGDYSEIEDFLKTDNDKVLARLYGSREQWRNSYQLAKLHPEWCELSWGEKYIRPQWKKRVPTIERVQSVLVPLGLETYVSRFRKWAVTRTGIDAPTLKKLSLASMKSAMGRSPCVAFDYESYDSLKHPGYKQARAGYVDVLNQKATGCSFAFGDNLQHSVYFSVQHRDTANVPLAVVEDVLVSIDDLPAGPSLVAHNASFEQIVTITNMERRFKRDVLDTFILAKYVNENAQGGLKWLSKSVLNYDQQRYDEVVPPDGDMRDVSLGEVLNYGTDDSICTAHLYVLFRTVMLCERTWEFCATYEAAFDRVMNESYIQGMKIDYARLVELRDADLRLKEETQQQLRALLQEHCTEFNSAGFSQVWGQIEPYERKLREEKALKKYGQGKVPESVSKAIEDALDEKREKLRADCVYKELSPPTLNWNNFRNISQVAKSLRFPGLRSIGVEWVNRYVEGIRKQAEDQDYTFDADQSEFLVLLQKAAPHAKFGMLHPEYQELGSFCDRQLAKERSLWVGHELNIDSPPQMAVVFYGMMNLPILVRNIDKTDDNNKTVWNLPQSPSTANLAIETWLAEINNEEDWRYKILKAAITLRKISTRFKLYYRPYPLFQSPVDGKVHPGIKNFGTKTARPSGTSPNVLQLTKNDGGKVRSMVLPLQEDQVVVSIDFVQQELVILAGESNDRNLRACYQGENRKDVHSLTATGILNIERARQGKGPVSYQEYLRMLEVKDKDALRIRKKPAKETNFLMAYMGSAAGLARKSVVPKDTATQWVGSFFETYPEVKTYQEYRTEFARRHGFVLTMYGTRKHCEGVFSKNKAVASAWARQASNHPIQGGAANILKVVMKGIVDTNLLPETGATVYAPVYDEIVASVPISKVFEYVDRLATIMEIDLPGLNIRLDTSVSLGKNWGDQIELGSRPSKFLVEKTNELLCLGWEKDKVEEEVLKIMKGAAK